MESHQMINTFDQLTEICEIVLENKRKIPSCFVTLVIITA